MIRALPYGFNYPIPRGWPTSEDAGVSPGVGPWEALAVEDRYQWRGFMIVIRTLARQAHHISELLIDENRLPTGLNSTMFNYALDDYDDLKTLIQQPGFSRLDLAVIVDDDWSPFRSGLFHDALAEARDLQHLDLRTTFAPDTIPGNFSSLAHFIPLQTIFPAVQWSKLRHFALSRFLIVQSDIVSFLAALPETLCTVELGFLRFLDNSGNWRGLLTDMRDTLRWHERDRVARPSVTIGLDPTSPEIGRSIWIEREIDEFLYAGGPNPFTERFPTRVLHGVGVLRDSFEMNYERPYVDFVSLGRLGYVKKSPH